MRFDDYDALRALLLAHALEVPSLEGWRHRWIDNPLWQQLGRATPTGWVLETAVGEVVGSVEAIPTRYKFRGSDLVVCAGAAFCVAASYRSYASQLLDEYFNQPVDLFISNTVGPAATRIYSAYSAKPIPLGEWDTTTYFVTEHTLFAKRALRKQHVPLASWLAHPTGWTLGLKDALCNRALPEPPRDVLIEATDRFDDRFDLFWDELVRENPEKLLGERSRRALSWHFEGAIRNNRLWIFTASKLGRLCGYCIVRHEPTPGDRRVSLIDYQTLDPERDLLPAFLGAALQRCAAEGFYVLQNIGVGVPKMRAFDEHAPYRRKLANWVFFYGSSDAALTAELRQPRFWDPSLYDGDASLD
jgi:hypothetical protein